MPRYYFHTRDGDRLIKDPEGRELRNVTLARDEAVLAARKVLADKIERGEIIGRQAFEICDSWGNKLLTVTFRSALKLK